tara:strand:+ start:358 stop:828 length:471 start_codon:yes stop_codon:yes gene_type:complete
MNNTNSTLYYDDDDNRIFFEILLDILFLFIIGFCIIIPCLYDDYDNIPFLLRPCHFWFTIIIYILVYIYNIYHNIKNYIYNIISCFIPIYLPQATIVYNISTENISQNITVIFNDSIIVNTSINNSTTSLIDTSEFVLAEPINISEEILLPHVTII